MPTVAELRKSCRKKGITGYSTLTKAQLERKCKVKQTRKKPSKAKRSKSPRVPEYMSPLEGRRLMRNLPQFTPPPVRNLPQFTPPPVRNLPQFTPPPLPKVVSEEQRKFVEQSMNEGVSKDQAEKNFKIVQSSEDDDELINLNDDVDELDLKFLFKAKKLLNKRKSKSPKHKSGKRKSKSPKRKSGKRKSGKRKSMKFRCCSGRG